VLLPPTAPCCRCRRRRPCSGTPESVDRDANIALFQEAASAASTSAAPAACSGGGTRGAHGGGGSGGPSHFMLVATFEGREAQAEVPLHRCAAAWL
jgi:hypothetical protein